MVQHLTPERRDQAAELYRRGEKVKIIAHLFNISESHITKLARRRDIPQRCPDRGRRSSIELIQKERTHRVYGNTVWNPGRGGRTIAAGRV